MLQNQLAFISLIHSNSMMLLKAFLLFEDSGELRRKPKEYVNKKIQNPESENVITQPSEIFYILKIVKPIVKKIYSAFL